MTGAAFTVPTTFVAINKFSGPVQGMIRSVNTFAAKSTAAIGKVERGFRGMLAPFRTFNSLLASAGLYIGLFTLVSVLRSTIGVVADFEQAQLNIQAVTGKSAKENAILAKQARQLAVDYGLAATKVSELQLELIKMGFAERKGGLKNILEMTPAVILGAKAMNAPESELANILGASMNLFKLPANEIIDLYAKGIDISALDFQKFSDMLRTSQQAWALSGRKLPELISSLAILSNAYVHAASAGTGLKNITLDNAVAGKEFRTQLMKIADATNPLVKGKKMYGRKAVLSAFPLAASMKDNTFDTLLTKLNTSAAGYAETLAKIKLGSINAKWAQAKSAWQEMILSIDDGTGVFSKLIKNLTDTTRAVGLLISDSDAAKKALSTMDVEVISTAQNWIWWGKWVWKTTVFLVAVKIAMMAWRAAAFLATAAVTAYNFVAGLLFVLTGAQATAFIGCEAAVLAYQAGIWLATQATRLLSLAIWSIPIFWIIAAIIAAIYVIYKVIDCWNEWGAAISLFMGPLGFVISLIQSFRRNWEMVMKTFSTQGIIAGIVAIGKVILDAIIMPIQQLFVLLGKLPGQFGATCKAAALALETTRKAMGVNTTTFENGDYRPPYNTKAADQEAIRDVVKTENKNLRVDFNNLPSWARVSGDKNSIGSITPALGSTFE